MKTLIVIESAEELIKFANRVRVSGDNNPVLPSGAELIFENDCRYASLQKCDGFVLSDSVGGLEIIQALANKAGLDCRFS